MSDLMSIITIEQEQDGSRYHVAESGYKNGLEYDYTVRMDKVFINNDWDAYECAVEAGLVEEGIENQDDMPEDVFVWRISDPHESEYKATEEAALEVFEDMIDLYYEAEIDQLDETLQQDGYMHADGGPIYDWMTGGMSDEDRAAFDMEGVKQQALNTLTYERHFDPQIAEYIWSAFAQRYPRIAENILNRAKGVLNA